MKDVLDFLRAALPWIAIGLLLAVFFAKNAEKAKKEEQPDNYGTEGMCLGMCLGAAIGTALGNNTGIGISLGMLIGLAVGTSIKKEGQNDKKSPLYRVLRRDDRRLDFFDFCYLYERQLARRYPGQRQNRTRN